MKARLNLIMPCLLTFICLMGNVKLAVAQRDTVLTVKVFMPDPASYSRKEYGGRLRDNNDADSQLLDSCLVWGRVAAMDSGGQIYLQNQYCRVADFSAPVNAQCLILSDSVWLRRSDVCFEAVNAYYHISTFAGWLSGMGFDGLIDHQVLIDPNGMGGADESAFMAGVNGVAFGKGNVDDAEDADVCVHEYGHAVHEHVAPGTNQGTERRATEEGNCDYLAHRYSSLYTDYKSENVYNWDGHNEFWAGRSLAVAGVYPQYLNGNIYHDGQLWASTLRELGLQIGFGAVDTLLLTSLPQYARQMSMKRAADLLLKLDSGMFAGEHIIAMRLILRNRGLLGSVVVGAKGGVTPKFGFFVMKLGSRYELRCRGTEQVGDAMMVELYDLQGRKIELARSEGGWTISSPLAAGVYLLHAGVGTTKSTQLLLID